MWQVASIVDAASSRGMFQCPDCLERYCLTCKDKDGIAGIPYHEGMSCEEYERSMASDKTFKEWTQQWVEGSDVKACPKCHIQQEKVVHIPDNWPD
jgi:hypothetical protein